MILRLKKLDSHHQEIEARVWKTEDRMEAIA